MQVIDLSKRVTTYVDDLWHNGTEVFILRAHSPANLPVHTMWLVDVVDLATGNSRPGRPASEPGTIRPVHVGPKTYPLVMGQLYATTNHAAEAQSLVFGYRYPNIDSIGFLREKVVAVRRPISNLIFGTPLSPWHTVVSRGPGGAVNCAPIFPPRAASPGLRLAHYRLDDFLEAAKFGDSWTENPYEPGSLIVPAMEDKVLYRVSRNLSNHDVVTRWDLGRPSGQRACGSWPLVQPLIHKQWTQRFIDAKLSPDGTKMYVSWASHNGLGDSSVAVYRTEDFEIVTAFTIDAGYLAPSADGLTLAVLSGVGGRNMKTQLRILDVGDL